ncbi:MAG: class I SAM-dependent methyltransferase [Nitrospirota bacterium]|nr:MAG: class I SAM-dependent methyltransferase [Nitrospirota bacterium]
MKNRLPPHPWLPEYYQGKDQRQGIINSLFDRIAPDYDWISQFLSFGSGKWHRQSTLRRLGLSQGMKVLDVACGPGTVGRCAKNLVGSSGFVVSLDPSLGMLQEAKKNSLPYLTQGLADHLPFHESTFDFVTMGYALRHVSDLPHTFKEYFRVLKPGGTVLILEISRPHSTIHFQFTKFFLKTVVPRMAQLRTRNHQALTLMRYFWDTIENCVSPHQILSAMEETGFVRSNVSEMAGGLIRDYIAWKPRSH